MISHMQQKRPDLHYLEGDALRLTPQFGEDAFDAVRHANSRLLRVARSGSQNVGCRQVFDKGTLQSVLLMRGGMGLAHTLAQECWNVLKPGG